MSSILPPNAVKLREFGKEPPPPYPAPLSCDNTPHISNYTTLPTYNIPLPNNCITNQQ